MQFSQVGHGSASVGPGAILLSNNYHPNTTRGGRNHFKFVFEKSFISPGSSMK